MANSSSKNSITNRCVRNFFFKKNQSEKINQKLFEVYNLKSIGKNFKLIKRRLTFAVSIYSNNTPGQRDPN